MPPNPWAIDESVLEAMRAFGAPAEDIERAAQLLEDSQAPERQLFEVHHDNLRSIRAWLRVSTQWQFAGMEGVRVGLNYAGVWAWLRAHMRPRLQRAVMADIEVMEHAALQAFHEIREAEE